SLVFSMAVFVWRCSASSRSRASRAISVSSPPEEEPWGRTAFGAMRLLRAGVLRRCALAVSPPALERRRIAAPRLRTRPLLVCVTHCLLVRTNALWRIAEAGTEQPVEVGNVGEAGLQCDVAYSDIAQVLCRKEHERVVQP